ncbi:hypothetical protein PMNALOAF_1030 [Methylobacterium adhaesivum]|uniref:Histidine kinase n=1 Tax=Methylobacterium adhaesivum TaxID=333297 RepID=A0ABT8BHV6_9HYPH|nr:histidine kinase [Methylobacterium adhaesivum]MDN3590820.1 histidine kinase [Methylobacterium adhaesivum]GJD29791.1 hypothetical protein PMNALOAF_1030 [Methylobacterium adhaesivum]
MADYYPLLARALEAMPDRSPTLRKAVYERARSALIGQLRSLDPPLSDADIDLEARALEVAIERLETDYAPSAPPPPPEPTAPAPADTWQDLPESIPDAPEPEPLRVASRASEPFLPPAPPPDLGRTPFMPPESQAPAPIIPIQARKGREPAPPSDSAETPPTAPEPAPPEPETDDLAAESGAGRQRPRIDVVAPSAGRSRLLRNIVVGAVLFTVIGLIAVAAFLLRDKPADLQPIASEQQDTAPGGAESKYADRIGGDPAPAASPARPAPSNASPSPAQPSAGPADLAVAQRAVFYEENTSAANADPTVVQGRVQWRLETVNGERGQPLETVVRANLDFPDAGIALTMTINRNRDATLPASHTIELAFTTEGAPGSARRTVQDIGLLQAKEEENARGSPVSGLPVRVRENLFLIGLSSLRNDIERNTDLLLHRNWFELAVKLSTGSRAILTFEKGGSGAQVMEKAFAQWQ